MSHYALRVPESLFAYARKVAEEEKVSALKTEAYFHERQARGDLASIGVPQRRSVIRGLAGRVGYSPTGPRIASIS